VGVKNWHACSNTDFGFQPASIVSAEVDLSGTYENRDVLTSF